jgi:hypothetical protein
MSARFRMACAVLALALCLGATNAPAAEDGAGTRAASFLSAGTAPSVLAMGGAALAFGRDVQGATLNPAALGWVATPQFALAHADLEDQTAQEWAAYGGRIGSSNTRFGLAAVIRDEGTIEGRDANDVPTADVRAQDLALTLQLARPFGEHLSVGGAAHVVSQRIGSVAGSGFAFDAGAQLRLGFLSLAVAGQDFGGGMSWAGQHWRMPTQFATGLALEAPGGLRLALDLNAPADYYRSVRAGAEWRWRDHLALRGGWRSELGAPAEDRLGGPAFGFGAGAGALWLDYGYVLSSADGAATHRVGLSLRGRPAAPASASR